MEEVSGHVREKMKPEDKLFETTTLPRKERLAGTVLIFLPKSSTGALLHAVSPEAEPCCCSQHGEDKEEKPTN